MDVRPRRAVHGRRGGPFVVVASCVVVVATVFTGRAEAARPPARWDTRLVPLVQEVERLRGLTFDHPVEVSFLAEDEFAEKVAIDRGDLTPSDERQLERSEATLRAVGLVGGDVDLLGALSDLQESGVLAYYQPSKERITVRGTELDVPTRVTLVHELTHALQDQHFDLARIRRRANRAHASSTARALIEGDAKRVELAYLDSLSGDDHSEYRRWQRDTGARVEDAITAADVPAALVAMFQSPYSLGQEMLRVVVAGRDVDAVDELFEDPPVADISYLDPRRLLSDDRPRRVPQPVLEPGDAPVGRGGDRFGAFALYLVLATSDDPVDALRVADGWGGDALVTFTRDTTTCIRANFLGVDEEASADIGAALQAWSASRGDGASVSRSGELTTLTACDAGGATVDPGRTPETALVAVVLRNTLLAQGAEQVGVEAASCVADRTVGDASFAAVLEASVGDPGAPLPDSVSGPFARAVTAALLECGRD